MNAIGNTYNNILNIGYFQKRIFYNQVQNQVGTVQISTSFT